MKFTGIIFLTLLSLTVHATEPKKAYEMVKKGTAVLIDVREMDELSEGMIDGAAWFPKSQMVPGSQILRDFRDFTKDRKVFVYCEGGKRAEFCKDILKREGVDAENLGGFKNLKNVLPVKTIYQRVNDPVMGFEADAR